MRCPAPVFRAPSGFTLVEVAVATAIVVTVATGVARLFAVAGAAVRASRDRTVAVALATGKIEQLRSLEWRYEIDAGGAVVARTDLQTDLSVEPAAGGGPGLGESPAGTLDADVPPYVDYSDRLGRWAGSGPSPPSSAVYIRRWAVRRVPSDPQRMLVLQVVVTTVRRERSRVAGVPHAWNGEDVLLATLRSRAAR